jgi:hypothetical protein
MWTTGWVVNAVACTEPAGCVATTSVFCGGGGGGDGMGEEPPPPPQPLASNATNKPPPNLRMPSPPLLPRSFLRARGDLNVSAAKDAK